MSRYHRENPDQPISHDWLEGVKLHKPLTLLPGSLPNVITFNSGLNQELARITPDGIMHFKVDASDENAEKFVKCIENFLNVRLTGINAIKLDAGTSNDTTTKKADHNAQTLSHCHLPDTTDGCVDQNRKVSS